MGSLRLAVLLSIALFGLDQGDRLTTPVTNADEIAGPWETNVGSDIEGIYINVDTAATQTGGSAQAPPWQTFQVNVYRRHAGETTNGWFAAKYEPTTVASDPPPERPALSFSNNHLRIVFASGSNIAPLDIDLIFVPEKHSWTGTWKASGETMSVTLSRPEAPQHTGSDPIVGDWKGESSATDRPRGADATICIRRSADGVLTVWMNRDLSHTAMQRSGTVARVGDIRSAELLRVVSFDKSELHLETANAAGANYDYFGKLSGDGNQLTGSWQGGGGTLNAESNFHRVTQ